MPFIRLDEKICLVWTLGGYRHISAWGRNGEISHFRLGFGCLEAGGIDGEDASDRSSLSPPSIMYGAITLLLALFATCYLASDTKQSEKRKTFQETMIYKPL